MNHRVVKQIIYGLVYLSIFAGIGYGIYFYQTRPICFDGIQNGKETGTDCGGKCIKACLVIAPLQTSVVKVFKVSEEDYDVLAKVVNPNQEYGSGNAGFALNGLSSNFYVLPNQTKYLVLRSTDEIVGNQLNITNIEWEKLNLFKSSDVNFIVTDTFFKGSEFEAVVFNDSDFDFDTVDVVVILYGEQDNVIAVNKTNINTLLSRTGRYFKAIWPEAVNGVVRTEVEVNTNLFKNSNFIKRYGSQEKFQEYYPDQR